MARSVQHHVRIRVQGELPAGWTSVFSGLAVTAEAEGMTVLSGNVTDQAALHGLLAAIRDLGLSLSSVETVAAVETSSREESQMSTTVRDATTKLVSEESCGTVISRWWHSAAANKTLLAGGIAGGVIYAIGDLLSTLLYEGYSLRDQAISELTAFGSPVRPLMVTVMIVHSLPLLALTVGLWRVSGRKTLRAIAAMLVGASVIGLPIHTVWAMSSRGMETGFNDTMHQALTAAWGVPIAVAVVLSAIAYRGWFRFFAAATVVVLIGFGAAATMAMGGIQQNLTPWAGAFERVSCYGFFSWLAVLALVVARRTLSHENRLGATHASICLPVSIARGRADGELPS